MTIHLETERLILRQFTEADVDALYALDGDPDVIRYVHVDGKRADYAIYRDQILPRFLAYYETPTGYGYWAVIEKASGAFIGWFHFRPAADAPDEIELGYRFCKSAWGKGYATEGSRALIRKGFMELGVRRVVAKALAANAASIHVMEKAGLKFDRNYLYSFTDPDTNRVTDYEAVKYALDRDDFQPD